MKRVKIPEDQVEVLDEAIAIWKDRSLDKKNGANCPLCKVSKEGDDGYDVCSFCVYVTSAGLKKGRCTEAWRNWHKSPTTKAAERIFEELTWIKENQL